MFKSPILQGGGAPIDFPKTIWTTYGGYYTEHPQWKRNTCLAFVGIGLLSLWTFSRSAAYERRWNVARQTAPVPSQRWAVHTLEDDPLYPQKLVAYKKNKKSLSERIFQTKEDFLEE